MQFNLYSLTCQETGKKRSWMESDRLPDFVVGGWTPSLNLLALTDCSSGFLGVLLPLCAILLLLLFAFFTLLKIFTTACHRKRLEVAAQWHHSSQICSSASSSISDFNVSC